MLLSDRPVNSKRKVVGKYILLFLNSATKVISQARRKVKQFGGASSSNTRSLMEEGPRIGGATWHPRFRPVTNMYYE